MEGNFLDLYSNYIRLCTVRVNVYYSQRHNKQGSIHTHLQMKSLKLSDQSSGWWRVGGGFLLEEGMEKINGKIRWDGIYAGGPENKRQRHRVERWSEILTINHWRHPEVFLRWPGPITNGTPPVQLGGIDTADFMTEKKQTVALDIKKQAYLRGSHITRPHSRRAAELICCNSSSCLKHLFTRGFLGSDEDAC